VRGNVTNCLWAICGDDAGGSAVERLGDGEVAPLGDPAFDRIVKLKVSLLVERQRRHARDGFIIE
jgi:hypothetical protein